jgi:hypothetical protein
VNIFQASSYKLCQAALTAYFCEKDEAEAWRCEFGYSNGSLMYLGYVCVAAS